MTTCRAGFVARSTVQLGKHLAALMDGTPLIAYDPRERVLSVPSGADLPGTLRTGARRSLRRAAEHPRGNASSSTPTCRRSWRTTSTTSSAARSHQMKPVPAPHRVMSEIQETLLSYIDTAYWLADRTWSKSVVVCCPRRERCSKSRSIEPVLPYPGTVPALNACVEVGLTPDEGLLLLRSVFGAIGGPDMLLREHQAEALLVSLLGRDRAGNPVVTSGTGSGKTEKLPAADTCPAHHRGAVVVRRMTDRRRVVGVQARALEQLAKGTTGRPRCARSSSIR